MADLRIFTKEINGRIFTQYAHTPADAVALQFSGWTEQARPAEPAEAEATEPEQEHPAPETTARPPFAAPAPAGADTERKRPGKSPGTDTEPVT